MATRKWTVSKQAESVMCQAVGKNGFTALKSHNVPDGNCLIAVAERMVKKGFLTVAEEPVHLEAFDGLYGHVPARDDVRLTYRVTEAGRKAFGERQPLV